MFKITNLLLALFFFPTLVFAFTTRDVANMPLLVIGSSYENGSTVVDYDFIAALGGAAVGAGSYLSLGDALIRDTTLGRFVINEASVGSTTFDRVSCFELTCLPGGKMLGYTNQFKKALLRVALRDPQNPASIIGYNAKYVVIGMPNDCLHSDAFGIPQANTIPCTQVEINQSADRIIDVAKYALSLGITPVIPTYPQYKDLSLSLVQQNLGFSWIVNETQYNELRYTFRERFLSELPEALVVDIWKTFKHRGDGIHPDLTTVKRAARKIKEIIRRHSNTR